MPVGHQKKFGMSSSVNSISESNFALAETRRRSADIFKQALIKMKCKYKYIL